MCIYVGAYTKSMYIYIHIHTNIYMGFMRSLYPENLISPWTLKVTKAHPPYTALCAFSKTRLFIFSHWMTCTEPFSNYSIVILQMNIEKVRSLNDWDRGHRVFKNLKFLLLKTDRRTFFHFNRSALFYGKTWSFNMCHLRKKTGYRNGKILWRFVLFLNKEAQQADKWAKYTTVPGVLHHSEGLLTTHRNPVTHKTLSHLCLPPPLGLRLLLWAGFPNEIRIMV